MKKIIIPESESSYNLVRSTGEVFGVLGLIVSIIIVVAGFVFLDSDGIEVAIYFFVSAVFSFLMFYVIKVALIGLSDLIKYSFYRHRYYETKLLEQDILFEVNKK